ncbi:hybrid sensor histidine kinase/response regulator transcription factor [Spirosoma utsteinense]|uniref:histidine kinase n=1 Tax=Spirosoma utsteinense TaxID=2585773 RepID=A0ABR6WCS6_9BACT|nr:two-component regulator propeller domain-containing protein [Spirosoma utsteinense]MBC3786784.1 signal transduction histidine kinase/DNA-binding response OmpR family regulator [Spirosoma utsteinense]MBC3793795.1 signal transduction histidine kinase/sugar lactone lactonase YvrE [Spirosoma utsteinense]
MNGYVALHHTGAPICRRKIDLFYWTNLLFTAIGQFFFFLFFLTGQPSAVAQPSLDQFEHLSVKDGLSHNSVNCMLQDRAGFMWLATNDGLNRYDGHTFIIFRPDPARPNHSFRSNRVTGLCQGRADRVWAVTEGGGLHAVDRLTGQVTPHPILARNANRWNTQLDVYEDSQGFLWLSTYNGLARYEPDRHHFVLYPSPQPDMPIKRVFEDTKQRLWVATARGLHLFDRRTGRYTLLPAPVSSGPQPTFNSFVQVDPNVLCLGTAGHGLFQLRLDTQPCQLTPYNPGGKINKFIFLHSLQLDTTRNLWIGTTEGLQRIDTKHQQVTTYRPDPSLPGAISSISAQNVYIDRAGTLWVGTDNGVDKKPVNTKPFVTYQLKPTTSTANLIENRVNAVLLDSQNRLWLSNYHTLHRTDARQGGSAQIEPAQLGVSASQTNFVFSMLPNGPDGIWLGTEKGLMAYDARSNRYTSYEADLSGHFMSEGLAGSLWIGSEGGIARFDKKTHRYTYYKYDPADSKGLPDMFVYALLASRTGHVWVAINGEGISRLDPRTGRFTHYRAGPKPGQLSSNEVLTFYEDAAGVLWAGTNQGGLIRRDPRTGLFSAVTIQEGLPSNRVVGIAGDAAGYLWLSTNQGLCRYDPRTGRIRSYTVNDGLPSNDFLENAVYARPGEILFGSLNGLVQVNPARIRDDRRPFPVQLTDFEVLNQRRPIPDSLITLAHNENFLSFEFAALTYVLPRQSRYAYQLVGVDANWVASGNRRFANYTDLPAGNYQFRVKASNSDGIWNERGISLQLIIRSPWWQTGWAYGFYALVIGGVLIGSVRLYTNRIRQQQEIELNRQQTEQLKIVDELKTRFFSNITHEFRTPLSLIISPVEKLLLDPQFDTRTRQTLALVQRNARQLLRLINQLLDLSKLEANSMGVSTMRGILTEFVGQLIDSFRPAAEQKGVTLHYNTQDIQQEHLFDADKWEKILTNLLSNALKFTGSGGEVTLTLALGAPSETEPTQTVSLVVADTGIGIPSEELPRIFDRFYQVDNSRTRAYEGTGIGLSLVNELVALIGGTIAVKSESGSGTTFSLTLPVQTTQPDTISDSLSIQSIPLAVPTGEHHPLIAPPVLVPADERPDDDVLTPVILVVEDNDELRGFVATELAMFYRVLTAANGEAGWQLAQAELPDVVVSDVMMPVMDGYELTRLIKSHPETEHIAVVILSARAAHQSRVDGLAEGADDYLAKPFNQQELHLRLRNLIGRQQKLRDYYRRQLSQPETPAPLETELDPFLRQIYERLETNLIDVSINVDWLSSELSMSRKTLYRKIHSLTQLAPNDLIRQYRLRKAADLLRSGHNAAETAYLTGFKTQSHFAKVFKNFYGQTPLEFINN